jgi:hypothetical protein
MKTEKPNYRRQKAMQKEKAWRRRKPGTPKRYRMKFGIDNYEPDDFNDR